MEALRDLGRRHAALKKKIHTTKFVLPPWGVKVAKVVYFVVPVVGGSYVMKLAIDRADTNLAQSTEFQRLKAERDKIAAEMEAARGERRLATVTAARTAAPVPARAVTATSPLVGLDWLCDDLPQ